MKQWIILCLTFLIFGFSPLFSQVKYDSDGDFGIGTTNPNYDLHVESSISPVVYINTTASQASSYLRLCEINSSFYGGYLRYAAGTNQFHIGVHNNSGTYLSDDKDILTFIRSSGQIQLHPGSTAYNFQSFVTIAPNYETQCYNVKLGSSNNFWVDGDGDVWHSGLHSISDISIKENIQPISNSIDLLSQLRPVKYNFKPGAFGSEEKKDKTEFGLIANEVESILPEIVETRDDQLKTISYLELIPLLIGAIQAQQEEIILLKNQISSIAEVDIKKSSKIISSTSPSDEMAKTSLSQNIPNPFDKNTIIKYSIPEINSYAMVNVYDLQGSQVKCFKINQTGDGEVIIPGSEFNPGLYIYNLIVDGKEISSRRMILTD